MNKKLIIVIVCVVALGVGYYIFVMRPQEIKLRCRQLAIEENKGKTMINTEKLDYENCVYDMGLKP